MSKLSMSDAKTKSGASRSSIGVRSLTSSIGVSNGYFGYGAFDSPVVGFTTSPHLIEELSERHIYALSRLSAKT